MSGTQNVSLRNNTIKLIRIYACIPSIVCWLSADSANFCWVS